MINQLIKVLFLFLALGATLLAAHYFRYDVSLGEDKEYIVIFDRFTGNAKTCDLDNRYPNFKCQNWEENITK